MGSGPEDSPIRKLVVFGASALVASVAFRALVAELELSPLFVLVSLWAVLTALLIGLVLVRARREGTNPRLSLLLRKELRKQDELSD